MLSHLKERFAIFNWPPFRKFFIAEFCASFANGFMYIANTWLVVSIGHSLVAVIWSFLAYWIPRALFLPLAGAIVDRVNRKYFVGCGFIVMGLCFGGFGVFLHFFPKIHLFWICVFYAILGAMGAFFMPAIMAFMREIVKKEDLLYANANLDLGFQISNISGIGLCGYFIHFFGFTISYLIMMALFVFSGFVVLLISSKRLVIAEVTQRNMGLLKQFWVDIHAALRYILKNKPRLILYLAQLFLVLILMVAPALLAPFAKTILHVNALEYGHIEFAMMIGMILGGLLLVYLAGVIGFNFILLFSTILLVLSLLGFSTVKAIMWAQIAYFFMGFSLGSWSILASMGQALTDPEYQGRVQALFGFLTSVAIILLYVFVHFASSFITIRHIYWVVAVFAIIPIALIVFYPSYFKKQIHG